MSFSKEYFIIVSEEQFEQFSLEQRLEMKHIEARQQDEYENNKTDESYMALYKKYKSAKKELRDYIYNKLNK